jgi:2-polyprenyl-3-methyl-5-hydroxy-6-metoxy-1,4-benzoquinol methylase
MLISDEYRELNRKLHNREDYGAIGARHADAIVDLARMSKSVRVLDYGCGKGTLKKALRATELLIDEYDPAVEGKDSPPESAEIVVCTDVLEHIEPECLEDVLDHLERLTEKAVYLTVSTVRAAKFLEDGRNAHLIQEGYDWWLPKIWKRWTPILVQFERSEFLFVGRK